MNIFQIKNPEYFKILFVHCCYPIDIYNGTSCGSREICDASAKI